MHLEFISNAPDRLNLPGGLLPEFFPQPLNMHIDSSGIPIEIELPNLLQKLFPCKNLVGMGSQEIEQLQLFGRQLQLFAAIRYGVFGKRDLDILVANSIFLLWRVLTSADNRLNAGDELLWLKGLDDIIICA